jgi:hypothetical protein
MLECISRATLTWIEGSSLSGREKQGEKKNEEKKKE